MYVTKLLWTQAHNLPGLEATVKEQVGHSLFACIGQQLLDDCPDLAAADAIFRQRLSWGTGLWQNNPLAWHARAYPGAGRADYIRL